MVSALADLGFSANRYSSSCSLFRLERDGLLVWAWWGKVVSWVVCPLEVPPSFADALMRLHKVWNNTGYVALTRATADPRRGSQREVGQWVAVSASIANGR